MDQVGSDQTDDAFPNQRADRGVKPALARVGRVLHTRSRPKALPTSRRLDPATHLVTSYRRWRNAGWKRLPVTKLYGEYKLFD